MAPHQNKHGVMAMKRAVLTALILGLAATGAGTGATAETGRTGKCPASRAHIAPQLKTIPTDGRYYRMQRQAIQVPIDRLVQWMGGEGRAFAIAKATRANALARLEKGATGALKRHWLDTITRADALIEILECRKNRSDA